MYQTELALKTAIENAFCVYVATSNMGQMVKFYSQILGLEILYQENGTIAFLIGRRKDELTTLVICDKMHVDFESHYASKTTIQTSETMPITFELDIDHYNRIVEQINKRNTEHKRTKFEWVACESVFIRDPDSNILEFTCFEKN